MRLTLGIGRETNRGRHYYGPEAMQVVRPDGPAEALEVHGAGLPWPNDHPILYAVMIA